MKLKQTAQPKKRVIKVDAETFRVLASGPSGDTAKLVGGWTGKRV